jgi:putative thioredoxin
LHILIVVLLGLITIFILFSRAKKPVSVETSNGQFEREITSKQFQEMVVQTSHQTPVLVDFYATWCPPCQYLTPLLSKLVEQYHGRFLLAKVDTDRNQNLTHEFGIKAMPTVMLFRNGKIIEQFTGGKLEHSIRYTLAKHGINAPNKNT